MNPGSRRHRTAGLGALLLAAWIAGCGNSEKPLASATANLPAQAACVLKSPKLAVGGTPELSVNGVRQTAAHRPDAPGPLELPLSKPGPQPAGACHGNQRYQFGTGIYDTTGPIGGNTTGHADLAGMVLPPQPQNGIHTRLHARAFIVGAPCNGKRVVFVSDDHTFSTQLVRQEVLKRIAAEPALAAHYGTDNIMLSATHTHAAPGGYGDPTVLPPLPAAAPQPLIDLYSYVQSPVLSTSPFDADHFEAMVGGIVQAIRRAHANLEANPQTAPVRMSVGELLNANRSRDPPAYKQNPPSERARYVDRAGHEVDVSKRFLQLSFVRDNGSAAGVLNWFGVHPTVMGNRTLMISGDSKGEASLGFERLMGTRYVPDGGAKPDGRDNFVAAFAQTDEGNAVPDLFIFDPDLDGNDGPGQGVPYRYRLGTDDAYDFDDPLYKLGLPKATAIFGAKQLAQALRQYGQGAALSGPVDYRLFYVDMSAVQIEDPVIQAQVNYPELPAELYPDDKHTCAGAVGLGKLVGGANGPVFGAAGFTCVADAPVPYTDELRNRFNGLYNGTGSLVVSKDGVLLEVPVNGVALFSLLSPLLCQTQNRQPQFECQREKVVLTSFGGGLAPFQLFRIGNLAVLGLPWEITTMAARRLRQTVLNVLAPVGIDTVVIAGLSNAYLDYMVTREEYAAQMYEGASTNYGPWQLAAAQQESRRLALSLAEGRPAPAGPLPEDQPLGAASPITTDRPAEFGAVLRDARPTYQRGETVDVSFVAGYPGNDLKPMSSYLYVEHETAPGQWRTLYTDKDPELLFVWNWDPPVSAVGGVSHVVDSSSAQALWTIPLDAQAGRYRIRHAGVSRTAADQPPEPYEGISGIFELSGPAAACPD